MPEEKKGESKLHIWPTDDQETAGQWQGATNYPWETEN